ncbi:hypothetical protein AMAG_12097 [Allomyces macrogynus ATCC 38327]|uniref:Uncharacterized protein n=1 Tax=Allomyces macrogynus (strain ATCC 38327) TaxID=578462 RepID=A0A0L0SZ10_ALLM3|nr:hypothetical protein AMAG_12097 [Allomyces macrogynus ATCC 38327]|eukprot:KNE67645.1 hypothetical protein AMAG_12097 [Allomyces macrogynus ATCC 38327]
MNRPQRLPMPKFDDAMFKSPEWQMPDEDGDLSIASTDKSYLIAHLEIENCNLRNQLDAKDRKLAALRKKDEELKGNVAGIGGKTLDPIPVRARVIGKPGCWNFDLEIDGHCHQTRFCGLRIVILRRGPDGKITTRDDDVETWVDQENDKRLGFMFELLNIREFDDALPIVGVVVAASDDMKRSLKEVERNTIATCFGSQRIGKYLDGFVLVAKPGDPTAMMESAATGKQGSTGWVEMVL